MRNRIIAMICTAVVSLSALCSLTGCEHAKNLGKSAIEKYVREDIGLTDFKVSALPKSVKSQNTFSNDRLWNVTDNESGVEFHVYDDHAGAGEFGFDTANYLKDDYGQQLILKYADELPELSQIEYAFADRPQRGPAGELYDYYEYLREYGYETGELKGTYTTRTELKQLLDEVGILGEALGDLGVTIPDDPAVRFRYMFEGRDGIGDDYSLSDGYVSVYATEEEREEIFEYNEPMFVEVLL